MWDQEKIGLTTYVEIVGFTPLILACPPCIINI